MDIINNYKSKKLLWLLWLMVYPGRYVSPRQRYVSPRQRYISPRQRYASPRQRYASPRQICLSQTEKSLSDRVTPFPDSPKSIISAMNQVPVARLGPILSQDGATASRNLSKHLQTPFPPAWDSKTSKNIENRRIGRIN